MATTTKVILAFLSALSIHQLAAQGEMVFLASRIEQGRQCAEIIDGIVIEAFIMWRSCRFLHLFNRECY